MTLREGQKDMTWHPKQLNHRHNYPPESVEGDFDWSFLQQAGGEGWLIGESFKPLLATGREAPTNNLKAFTTSRVSKKAGASAPAYVKEFATFLSGIDIAPDNFIRHEILKLGFGVLTPRASLLLTDIWDRLFSPALNYDDKPLMSLGEFLSWASRNRYTSLWVKGWFTGAYFFKQMTDANPDVTLGKALQWVVVVTISGYLRELSTGESDPSLEIPDAYDYRQKAILRKGHKTLRRLLIDCVGDPGDLVALAAEGVHPPGWGFGAGHLGFWYAPSYFLEGEKSVTAVI